MALALETSNRWWAVVLRGVCGVIFGLIAFAWPGLTLAMLVLFYGAYAFADGILAMVAGARGGLWGLFLVGLLGLSAGIVTFVWPGITSLALLYAIAFWAIARGAFEIVAAVQLRKVLQHEWLLALTGAVAIAWGVALIVHPAAGALSLTWLIGAFSLTTGLLLIVLGIRLRTARSLPVRSTPAYTH